MLSGCQYAAFKPRENADICSIAVLAIASPKQLQYEEPRLFLSAAGGVGSSRGDDPIGALIALGILAGAVVEEGVRLPANIDRPARLSEAARADQLDPGPEMEIELRRQLESLGYCVESAATPVGRAMFENPVGRIDTKANALLEVQILYLGYRKLEEAFKPDRFVGVFRVHVQMFRMDSGRVVYGQDIERTSPDPPHVESFDELMSKPRDRVRDLRHAIAMTAQAIAEELRPVESRPREAGDQTPG